MDSNPLGEDLVKMSFMNLKTEVCLTDAEQMCKHNVVSILNTSSLMKWDVLSVTECEGYPKDPHTERTSEAVKMQALPHNGDRCTGRHMDLPCLKLGEDNHRGAIPCGRVDTHISKHKKSKYLLAPRSC